jgi:hypothetical protein
MISVGLVIFVILVAVRLTIPGVFECVIARFFDPHAFEFGLGKFLQALINLDTNVLGSRYLVAKCRNLFVQRAMIESLDHLPFHESIKLRQIHDHSRSRIHRP